MFYNRSVLHGSVVWLWMYNIIDNNWEWKVPLLLLYMFIRFLVRRVLLDNVISKTLLIPIFRRFEFLTFGHGICPHS